jgi:ribosomal protein S18 acetylase RimI-like enzyme
MSVPEDRVPAPTISEIRDEEELQPCVALLRAAFGTVAEEFGLTELSAPTNAAFTTTDNLRKHLRNGMTLYGMSLGTKLVGCVAFKKSKAHSLVFYIERLAVAPEERHRGYGDKLLAFAIEQIEERGGTTASIGLMDNNARLKEWYNSKGFVQHDCRRIAGLPFKVCFMSKSIVHDQG